MCALGNLKTPEMLMMLNLMSVETQRLVRASQSHFYFSSLKSVSNNQDLEPTDNSNST